MNLRNFGRRQGPANKLRLIRYPVHDIDFLAAQFLHDRLHPSAFHTDTSAHRIDVGIMGNHGDLGAPARFARGAFDFDDAFVNLRNFLREKLDQHAWMRAR